MSAFNLPPPWDPKYALPDNVEDEGLERHGYVTEWARRGSFDNPKVGTAGYAVPQYIKDEHYGRGAMVTKWAPRGSYAGPKVKHWLDSPSAKIVGRQRMPGGATQLDIETMAGNEIAATGGAPFTAYGMKTAKTLLDTVAKMPAALRKPQLKAALDAIDPTLWSRAEANARAETKAGVPAKVALERGLASAMSRGLAEELVAVGRGRRPAKRSQLALCGLGADFSRAAGLLSTGTEFTKVVTPSSMICLRPGYTWVAATAALPAHYERLRAGRDPNSGNPGPSLPGGVCAPTEIVVHPFDGGLTPEQRAARAKAIADAQRALETRPRDKLLQVGPFLLPTGRSVSIHYTLSDEQAKFVVDSIMSAMRKQQLMVQSMKNGTYPFAKFKRPDDGTAEAGKMFGLYLKEDGDKTYIEYKEYVPRTGTSLFGKIWNAIKAVASAVVDFAKDALNFVKDTACSLLSSGAGQIAGAAAGAAVGGASGAQFGAMGAQVAAGACQSAPPTCPAGQYYDPVTKACAVLPPPASSGSSMMPLLLIGGAGIAAFLLLKKKP